MDINYEYYKVFYYVGKYRSMTMAAKALGRNQPNVTRVIRLLEQSLGRQLFLRTSRGLLLTEAGERLYERVSAACEQLQAAEEELRIAEQVCGGAVTLGTTETALHLFLFPVLEEFRRLYPQVRLRLHNYNTPQTLRQLQNGGVELAVVPSPHELPAGIRKVELYTFQDILIAGREYSRLASAPAGRRFEEALSCPWVSISRDTATYALYNRFFEEHGATLEPDVEVATADLILPMVKNNLGIGYLPEELAVEALRDGEVFRVPMSREMTPRHIYLAYDEKRGYSQQAQVLKQYLMKYSSLPGSGGQE